MSALVPRAPGWVLVAGTSGVHGWHVVDRANAEGSITTLCGIVGRVIREDEPFISTCSGCLETLGTRDLERSARTS